MSSRIFRPALLLLLLLACTIAGPTASGDLILAPELEPGEPIYRLNDLIIVLTDPDRPLDAAEIDRIREDPTNALACNSWWEANEDVTFTVYCDEWYLDTHGHEARIVGVTSDGRWYGETLVYLEDAGGCAGSTAFSSMDAELVIDRPVVR